MHEEALLLVAVQRGEGRAGREVADVVIARVAHRADALHGLVDPVAGAEGVLARRIGLRAEEDAALHQRRARHAGDGQRGGGHVEQADDLVVDGAGLDLRRRGEVLRPADDHRHVQAAVVAPVDAARLPAGRCRRRR